VQKLCSGVLKQKGVNNMKRTLCILLSVVLMLTGLVGLGVTASAYSVGDIILFGNYPQTKVSETTALKNAANAATWKSYGYYVGTNEVDGNMAASDFMKYADFSLNGVKYRAVKFTKYRPSNTIYLSSADHSQQDDNGYSTNTIYYFKYEPIEWRVLDPSAGLILCEMIIDAQAYQNVVRESAANNYYIGTTATFANNYAESSIRTWLNHDFYNTAFNTTQKNKIISTTSNNAAYSSEHSQYNAVSTTDPIFLLSYGEAQNSSYGLTNNDARKAKGTDYAKCQGLLVFSSGFSGWRLRSAGSSSDYACYVQNDGALRYNYFTVCGTTYGLRPACKLTNLTSDISQFETYTVTATASPTAGGTVTGSGTYPVGQSATVTATANSGYLFFGWYKDSTKVSTNKSYTFTVTENVTLTAKFSPLSMNYTVTATANPSEGGTVSGGGSYSAGKTATVTATPKSGWHFIGWFEDNVKVSDNASYSFTVTENATLTAKFVKDNPTQNAKLNMPQSAEVGYKSTVTVTATAEGVPEGYFVALYDGDTQIAKGDNKTVSCTMKKMTGSKTLTAKIVNDHDEVQSNADGELKKDITITVKTGFFDKLIAFFKGLFGLLPKVELKP
jgi:uncharacterized repeat protein (TIGR02543 family)